MNNYLANYLEKVKAKLGDNLAALPVYGSYKWGYFDPENSDYDMWLLTKTLIEDTEEALRMGMGKISLHYILTLDELLNKIRNGSIGNLITFLSLPESAEVLYSTEEFDSFVSKVRRYFENDFDCNEFSNNLEQRLKSEKEKFLTTDKRDDYYITKINYSDFRLFLQAVYLCRTKEVTWNLEDLRSLNDLDINSILDILKEFDSARRQRVGVQDAYKKTLNMFELAEQISTNS